MRSFRFFSFIQRFHVWSWHFVSLSHPKFLCTVETFCVTQPSKVFMYSWDILCHSAIQSFYVQLRHFVWFLNHPLFLRTDKTFCVIFQPFKDLSYCWEIYVRSWHFFVVSQLSKDALVRSLTFCMVSEHFCAVSVLSLISQRKLTEFAKPAVT